MKPSWTEEQKQVIHLRNRNMLVSAAAGSGKTAVLVERIIQKITQEDNPCDLDRLLVVTFTKAAAAEMRVRIGNALEEKLQENPENQHLQKQVSLLHTAQITTIDSFCQSIIKNYFHVINLDPSFRVGDETELKVMRMDIFKALLEEKYSQARKENNERFLRFTDIFSPGRTDSAIENIVLSLFEAANSYPWPEEWLMECAEMYRVETQEDLEEKAWAKNLIDYLRKCIENFLQMAKDAEKICMEPGGPQAYLEAIQSDIQYLKELQDAYSYQKLWEVFAKYNPARLRAVRAKEVDEEKKEIVKRLRNGYLKEGLGKLRSKFFFQSSEDMLADMQKMAPFVRELILLTLDFQKAFTERKREEGLLDFADMEHFALEILVSKDEKGIYPSETALELQEYYDEIMTDEYQDSNYVQELLLTSLCRAPEQKPYLFMVGDVKQSIYKFRLARPELFMKKYDSYTVGKGPYQRIDLHQNFRSRAGVLESANYIFEHIMKRELGGIEYDNAARLVPGADYEKLDSYMADKTEVLLIESQTESGMVEKKSLEAAAIGQKIREMVQGKKPFLIQDKKGSRPLRYGDIAILLRGLTGWSEEFIGMFNDMGIPAYSETKTGYFTTLEVETILNFLYIIDNPRQDIPLAATLRSQLGGVTDEELAWIGTMPQEINFWDKIEDFLGYREWKRGNETAGEKFAQRGIDFKKQKDFCKMPEEAAACLEKKLSDFLDRLRDYQRFSQSGSVYELLRRIYDETGYYHFVSAMPAGEKRRANLDILLQQAVEFSKNGHGGIYGFTKYIENLQKSDVDFGEAVLANENMNAVRIMTIHKSKGLEFPVVFVAGMGRQFNLMDVRRSTIISSDYGIGCDFVDLEMRYKQPTLMKRFLANDMLLGTLAEEIRILYVALTRAKEKLWITGTVKNLPKQLENWRTQSHLPAYYRLTTAQTYFDWIMAALAKRPAIRDAMDNYIEKAEDVSCFRDNRDELFGMELLLPEEVITEEKTEQKNRTIQYKQLKNWDIAHTYDEEMRRAIEAQLTYQYPYAYDAVFPVKVSVSELKRREMLRAQAVAEDEEIKFEDVCKSLAPKQTKEAETDIPRPSFMREKAEISGAARGTLYHMAMEHFPYQAVAEAGTQWNRALFVTFLEEMVQKGYMRQEEADLLDVRKFEEFIRSALGRRMADAAAKGVLYLEQPFMMGVPASTIDEKQTSEELVMVQGIIDAFFIEEDHIILVDYKTDAVGKGRERELIQKYQTQLDYYAQALERLAGKKVSEKIIYSFALGKEILL